MGRGLRNRIPVLRLRGWLCGGSLIHHGKDWIRIPGRIAAVWVVLLSLAVSDRAQDRRSLHGHVPDAVTRLPAIGPLSTSTQLKLAIGLPLRDRDSLANLLQQVYDPASPNYRHYLTPQQFTERFGPTEKDYQAVIDFAKANGLAVTGTHPNRLLVDVKGSVTSVERAFHVTMRVYRHPTEPRTFYAPSAEPSIAAGIPILDVSGLNNYILPHPLHAKATPFKRTTMAVPCDGGSGPGGTYISSDFRAAYAPGVWLTGAGQAIGLVQFDGYYTNDISAYESLTGLPAITLTNILLDGFDGSAGDNNAEVALDIEMAIAMAPGLSQVILYEGGPNGTANDILNRMATDNQASQLSTSWGWNDNPDATTDQIFQEMAAQGQSFFAASGDNGAWVGDVLAPSDNTNITIVGGTTLTTSNGAWASETTWNWNPCMPYASGGGTSTFYSIPPWQQNVSMTNNMGSTTMRNFPDVALTADNVFAVYDNGITNALAGTSCSAPLWAGFIALVNQQAAAADRPTVGFINPAIYAIGTGTNYLADFNDITTGDNTNSSDTARVFCCARLRPLYRLGHSGGTRTDQRSRWPARTFGSASGEWFHDRGLGPRPVQCYLAGFSSDQHNYRFAGLVGRQYLALAHCLCRRGDTRLQRGHDCHREPDSHRQHPAAGNLHGRRVLHQSGHRHRAEPPVYIAGVAVPRPERRL